MLKQVAPVSALAALAGVALFALGPRVPVDTNIHEVALPESGIGGIEGYLADGESRFRDLIPGTEKLVVWANPQAPQVTPLTVVYIHGFSASRQELWPLPQMVADSVAANLFLTRLTGHGRSSEAMAEASVQRWLQDGEEAMAVASRLGERVVVMGTSTGGTLALWLAAQERWRDRIAAVILVSPNLGPHNRSAEVLLWPWGGTIARLTLGPERSFTTRNELQARYWTERYPVRALLPMMGLVGLVRDLDPGEVQAPVLVAFSPRDRVVDVPRIEALFPRLGSARKQLLPVEGAEGGDYHVLAGDILAPENNGPLAAAMLSFLAAGL
ncbi:MAG: alpha/beta fold hydrolase [Gemmatimonadales bacterium]|nr:MAG: alpha/beta fold hydrolase [Gemmatimonadales bacterium]